MNVVFAGIRSAVNHYMIESDRETQVKIMTVIKDMALSSPSLLAEAYAELTFLFIDDESWSELGIRQKGEVLDTLIHIVDNSAKMRFESKLPDGVWAVCVRSLKLWGEANLGASPFAHHFFTFISGHTG